MTDGPTAARRTITWLASILQAGGALLLAARLPGTQPVDAFAVMTVGAFLWFELALRRSDHPLAAQQAVFLAINVLGLWRWFTP